MVFPSQGNSSASSIAGSSDCVVSVINWLIEGFLRTDIRAREILRFAQSLP
jgi:hypothetical protein